MGLGSGSCGEQECGNSQCPATRTCQPRVSSSMTGHISGERALSTGHLYNAEGVGFRVTGPRAVPGSVQLPEGALDGWVLEGDGGTVGSPGGGY